MSATITPQLTAGGISLDMSPEAFGRLRVSNDIFLDGPASQQRMRDDGYLYFQNVLDIDVVLAARAHITERLAAEGYLDPGYPHVDAIANPDADIMFRPDLAQDNPPLHKFLYSGELMRFFERFLAEEVLHYDFTWLRATKPGGNAPAHCDIVYMGRGTFDVFTTWTPLGNIAVDGGALMILEGSHLKSDRISDYLQRDVDAYCLNAPTAPPADAKEIPWEWDGSLDHDAFKLRERLGGRWLSSDFSMGDILVFTMATVHASIDNLSNRIRLSSDSRYQRASEPADERWIGPAPIGHGRAGKRGRIC